MFRFESAEHGYPFHSFVCLDVFRSIVSFGVLCGTHTGRESSCWDVSDERDTLAMGSTRLLVAEEDDSVLIRGLLALSWLEDVCFVCSN